MAGEKVWKPLELVKVTAEYLAGKGVDSPRLDAELLLCRSLGLKRRVDLYAGFETEVSPAQLANYRELVRRRSEREPVSRILGQREFMGIPFKVTPAVLSPRPETELLVEMALAFVKERRRRDSASAGGEMSAEQAALLERLLDDYAEDAEEDDGGAVAASMPPASAAPVRSPRAGASAAGSVSRVLDLGTGSGCIAVAVAAMAPEARVTAVDVSGDALEVARENAGTAGVAERVEFRRGDWFAACRPGERFDLVLANPPYLVEGDSSIWEEAWKYDPKLALYGGLDGLDCYRSIAASAAAWLAGGGMIAVEVGAGQAAAVRTMLAEGGLREVGVEKDHAGVERVVKGRL